MEEKQGRLRDHAWIRSVTEASGVLGMFCIYSGWCSHRDQNSSRPAFVICMLLCIYVTFSEKYILKSETYTDRIFDTSFFDTILKMYRGPWNPEVILIPLTILKRVALEFCFKVRFIIRWLIWDNLNF